MKPYTLWLNVILLLALLLPIAGHPTTAALSEDLPTTPQAAAPVAANASEILRNSPVMFIENVGQFAEGARFQVRGGNGTLWLADDALWITIVEPIAVSDQRSARSGLSPAFPFDRDPESGIENRQGINLRLSFPNANPNPRLEPFDRLETTVSYFLGNDPDSWRPAVPVWGGVRYVDLYPGIDLEVTSEGGQFVQRLHAQLGADLSQVQLRVEGVEAIELAGVEGLRLSTAVGDYILPLLTVADSTLDAHPAVSAVKATTFDIAAPLTLSPRHLVAPSSAIQNQNNSSHLLYGTLLGGSDRDIGYAIAVDEAGAAYIAGFTFSSDFPTKPGAFDTSHNGNSDVFVAKLNADGSGLAYSTFLGGSGSDSAWGIAVDGAGAAYVTGNTNSADFPATPGSFDTSYNGDSDAFVVKLNAAGSDLAYSTFLGGSSGESGRSIAVDEGGAAYVTGSTRSSNFPTTPGAYDTTQNGGDDGDAFVAKLNPAGSALAYATFLGGIGSKNGYGIAVDSSGAAYVTGRTGPDFPTTPGAYDPTYNGGWDAFVAKLNPAGSALEYATFLGGNDADVGDGIAVDGGGAAYVTGVTCSSNFPTTPGAYDTTYNGGNSDAFVAKLNPAGSALAYATFLGGHYDDHGYGIAVDSSGSAYVTGYTYSSNFPTTLGAFDTSYNGNRDAFVVKLDMSGGPEPDQFYVTTTWPADEATGVLTSTTEITARFNKPAYPLSVNALTMSVWDGGARISGTVEYRPNENTAVFIPDRLSPGTRYLVMLTPSIVAADDQTQHLELYGWWFTTEGSERDRLIQTLEDLKIALVNKITYDAQILSIDFTLARYLHRQKSLLDFLSISSDVFLLWAGKDAGALFGPLSEFTDMVGKVGLAAKTAGLVDDAQAMDSRLWEIVRIADQEYGGDPLEGREFNTSGYQNYFRNAVMDAHSPVNAIPLLYGPVGYTPSILATTNAYGIQYRIASQFDTLIDELPNPLPAGLDVEGLVAEINEVTRSVWRSQQREEEVRYSAYFPGHWELFPQSHWLGVIAEDSKMTSRIANDAEDAAKEDADNEEAEFTVMKTAMAGTKLVLLVTSAGGAATAEAIYQLVDVAMLPSNIRDFKQEFEQVNPHTLLDQHVYRMVMHYGLETATVWRIANEMALSVDHRVRYPYTTTGLTLNVAPEFTVGGLELQNIELADTASVGEGTGAITISNTSTALLRARLTGYIDTPIAGSAETSIISVFGSESPRDIAPGATEVLTFTYSVFSSSKFGVQGYHAQALLHIINLNTLEHIIHGPIDAHFFMGKDSVLKTMEMQRVYVPMTGTLAIGQTYTQTVTLQPTTRRVRLQLIQDFRSDFDLHLYDALGRHVGYNYSNATTEADIPGSVYSGRDARAEWIEIAPITSALQLIVQVVAVNSDGAANYSVVAIETPTLPAVVSIFPENLVHQTRAPTTTIQFAVREIGKQSDLTEITLLASDLRSNSVDDLIPFANIGFTLPVTTVMAGGELYITGTITLPDNLAEATYTGTVTVQGRDSSTMTPVTTTMQLTLVYVRPKQIYLPLVLRQF